MPTVTGAGGHISGGNAVQLPSMTVCVIVFEMVLPGAAPRSHLLPTPIALCR
jgi:hypothetical protein